MNHVTFQKTADEIRIENIQHVYLNGKEKTLFKVYVKHYSENGGAHFVFSGQYELNGIIKRESTIKRKICLI